MHVGLLISGSLDKLTGGYIYDRQLIEYLKEKGHQIELIYLPCRSYLDRLLYSPRLTLNGELNHLSLDVLLQDELDHPALIRLNRRLKDRAGYPIVSIVHHLRSCELRPAWQNTFYRRIEKHYLMSVDGFVFNSLTTRRTVESLVGTPRPGVIAYPCGDRLSPQITDSEIADRAGKPGPLRVVFLGSLIRRKALHILLAALAYLPTQSYFLTIIGDLSADKVYVRAIQNQIRENRLIENVSLLGPLTDSELGARLKENHILVVPSYYEGFGIAYLEGMGFGLPAIGTSAGAAGEIISHGENGFLIPAGDYEALSRFLRELIEDRHRLVSMSLNARRRFTSHPTWQITCECILNFLQSSLQNYDCTNKYMGSVNRIDRRRVNG